jgi:cysteine synthase
MPLSRRDAFKLSGVVAATTAVSAYGNSSQKSTHSKTANKAPIKDKTSTRVVIVGGGWSGLSVAKSLKNFSPKTEVILVEQKDIFISCPMSNLWLVNRVDLDYLTHDYLEAARQNNYTFFSSNSGRCR